MSKQFKIDKEFLLTDSSVNSYGFRMLTSGYLMEEYAKNPIGFYMHNREDGVVLRWEDLRKEGDEVYGKPVINMSHPRAQQTIDEIENGFLNAASCGHIIVLEWSEESSLKLPNQTGPTFTKWFNRECSLVDIPGNFNALKLYDKDEKEINLADFAKQTHLNMKTISFTAAQLSALNLKSTDPSEQEVASAFTDLVARAAKVEGLEKQLNDLNAKVSTDKVKSILDTALVSGKITKELSDKLAADYATNPKGLEDLMAAMPAYKSITDTIEKAEGNQKRIADLSAKSFDDLMLSGESEELKKLAPEVWKEKLKEI